MKSKSVELKHSFMVMASLDNLNSPLSLNKAVHWYLFQWWENCLFCNRHCCGNSTAEECSILLLLSLAETISFSGRKGIGLGLLSCW